MITYKVSGFKECEAALDELTNATARNVIRRALVKAGEPVEVAAKQYVPVNTGLMKSDITTALNLTKSQREHKSKSAVAVYVGVGGKRGSFAHLVEFGTAQIAPVGFMRKAADSNMGRVVSIFIRELKAEVEKAKERARRKAARILAKG